MIETTTELPASRLLGRYSYPTSHRVIEIVAVGTFVGFGAVFASRMIDELAARLDLTTVGFAVAAVFLALVTADVLSGVVHALCDNLGSVHTPVVGQKFIRSFREHHTDPLDMTRGDCIRVNADNFLVCLPILVPCVLWLDEGAHLFASTFLVALMGFVVVTNQIHKWAHMAEVPASVRWLQARRFVLSPEHHRVHHTPPYSSHYCITSGITNPLLSRVGFWPALLRLCRWAGRFLGAGGRWFAGTRRVVPGAPAGRTVARVRGLRRLRRRVVMKDRVFQLVMVVAVACVAVAIWSALQEEIHRDTRCGPVFTQQNRGVAACDDFYQARYVRVGALFGAAIVAWGASAVIERSIERSGRRVDDL